MLEKDTDNQTRDRHMLRRWILQSSEDSPYCGIEKPNVLLPNKLIEQTLPVKRTASSLGYFGCPGELDHRNEDERLLISGTFTAGADVSQNKLAFCGSWQYSIQPETYSV